MSLAYMSHTETAEQNVNRRLNHRTFILAKETELLLTGRHNFKNTFRIYYTLFYINTNFDLKIILVTKIPRDKL